MLFNVPQFVDIEDKIVGPFTAKQLLWMFGMGAVLMVVWTVFDQKTFWISSVPIVLLFLALAFYRPYGLPFIKFIFLTLLFIVRPKVYVWQRESGPVRRIKPLESEKRKSQKAKKTKELKIEDIRKIAQIMDKY